MRKISAVDIARNVAEMCCEANYILNKDITSSLEKSLEAEESQVGREVLKQLLMNAEIAKNEEIPICQDTGFALVFLELGQEAVVVGGDLEEAVNKGVKEGYLHGHLRKSIVEDPLKRVNTDSNTPAVIHYEIVPGDRLKITLAPKGGGSENMSALKMLKPAEGEEGIINFVVETVNNAGPNPCPPLIIGVGIGGNFERSAFLAKKALLRPLAKPHHNLFYGDLEKKILEQVNNLGIGPQGFGGGVTALAVHVEVYSTHIACLPVAVNINCHASRHVERIL